MRGVATLALALSIFAASAEAEAVFPVLPDSVTLCEDWVQFNGLCTDFDTYYSEDFTYEGVSSVTYTGNTETVYHYSIDGLTSFTDCVRIDVEFYASYPDVEGTHAYVIRPSDEQAFAANDSVDSDCDRYCGFNEWYTVSDPTPDYWNYSSGDMLAAVRFYNGSTGNGLWIYLYLDT